MLKKIFCAILVLAFLTSAQAIELPFGFSKFGAMGAKNVILIVPDGCSVPIWASIRAMTVGVDGQLAIDSLPVNGRCRTYSADAMITDSAAGGTTYATGFKTRNGILSMHAMTTRGDSLSGKALPTILEKARDKGIATGLISTAMIQHATPACFYSHRADRDWYNLIANDLVDSGIDLIMGGGRQHMIPMGSVGPELGASKREDSRNLLEEMQSDGYILMQDKVAFDAYEPEKGDKVLGIFNPGHMQYELDRAKDTNGEPALWEMTEKALELLSKNRKGFFLMVEAARIDHAGHDHDTDRFLWDGIACDKTVAVAKAFAEEHPNTLLIVVPDHGTGGPHLVGLTDKTSEEEKLLSYNEAGFPKYRLDSEGFPIEDNGRPLAIQWVDWGGHTGEDVALFAMGPNSELLGGLVQNTYVNRVMMMHLGLIKTKDSDDDEIDY